MSRAAGPLGIRSRPADDLPGEANPHRSRRRVERVAKQRFPFGFRPRSGTERRRGEPFRRIPRADRALRDLERRFDDVGDSRQRVLGAARAQRLRAEARERRDLDRSPLGLRRLRLRANQQIRRDDRRDQKRHQRDEVERLVEADAVVRRLEVVVDQQEAETQASGNARRRPPDVLAPSTTSRYTRTTCT